MPQDDATPFTKPFDGAISTVFENEFPEDLRAQVRDAGRKDIIAADYPYDRRMRNRNYEAALEGLHIELAKMQRWIEQTGQRIVILFEGRDAAGKGGTIKRLTEHLNPRVARVVALGKPSDRERGQWYFQRYAAHLPARGEMTVFDRSWYNRAVVEPVMGFCTPEQTRNFLQQVPEFERALVDDGVHLVKLWLTVSRGEQMRRFLKRESDPLKHWKLSPVDIALLGKWNEVGDAREEMFERTHREGRPWTIVRAEDKRRARLAAIRVLLSSLDYDGKDPEIAGPPDERLAGPPGGKADLT